jgi:hypothetical protein
MACALFAAMAKIVLAFARFAHAGSIGTDHSQKAEKVKKGTLKIAVASNIGALRLGPGEYEVKQVNSAGGPVVRFTRYT